MKRTAKAEAAAVAGKDFPAACREVLAACGFSVEADGLYIPDARVNVDVIATNRNAISFYIMCTGAHERPVRDAGAANASHSRASAAYKRAFATAQSLHGAGWGPLLLLTSYAPDTPRARALLAEIDPDVLFDVVNPLNDVRRLRWLANADERQLRHDLEKRRRIYAGGSADVSLHRIARMAQNP
jgi:hypothetical protein